MPADIAASLSAWVASSADGGGNLPTGGTAISTNLDDNLRMLQSVVRIELATRGTVASATTTDIGAVAAGTVEVTGTTTITGFGTVSAGIRRRLVFAGALTLTHNATSLKCITQANITTAAGDTCEMESEGSGNWKMLSYEKYNGIPLSVLPLTSGDFLTNNGTSLSWSAPTVPINVSAKSSNYTVVSGDRSKLISCTSSFTLTLTAASSLGAGWACYVENAGTGDITLSCSTNIDGITTGYIMYPGEQRLIISDGTNFETVLLCGGSRTYTAGAVSFKAPPGVKGNSFRMFAVSGGQGGGGNGTTAGAGGRGGTGCEFAVSLTPGTTYTGTVGAGGTYPLGLGGATSLTGVFDLSSAAFDTANNPYVEGIHVGGAAGAAGNQGKPSVFGGGGGGGGPSGTGGASFRAGAGGNGATAGTAPGGGGGGGNTTGTTGQSGADGTLVISW